MSFACHSGMDEMDYRCEAQLHSHKSTIFPYRCTYVPQRMHPVGLPTFLCLIIKTSISSAVLMFDDLVRIEIEYEVKTVIHYPTDPSYRFNF